MRYFLPENGVEQQNFYYLCTNLNFTDMKRLFLTLVALAGLATASAQLTPNKIVVPDIEGYKTLKGDFHIHTVFTDATVWPVTRVHEIHTHIERCIATEREAASQLIEVVRRDAQVGQNAIDLGNAP